MANARIEFKIGNIEFVGEGEQDWVTEQLDKVLTRIPELAIESKKITPKAATPQVSSPKTTQTTEHDFLNIAGDAEFNGDINILLGYSALIGDQFVIAETGGEITECNLPTSKTIEFGGENYVFAVQCQNNNQLVLELTAITPLGGNGDYDMDGSVTVSDLGGFLGEFGSTGVGLIGDFNGDGAVNVNDLGSFLSAFGTTY